MCLLHYITKISVTDYKFDPNKSQLSLANLQKKKKKINTE